MSRLHGVSARSALLLVAVLIASACGTFGGETRGPRSAATASSSPRRCPSAPTCASSSTRPGLLQQGQYESGIALSSR
jgi:hypothetical protein